MTLHTYCGRLIYEGSLDKILKGSFVKSPDGTFVRNKRQEFSLQITIVSPNKIGRISEATVYSFSPIEGIAREAFDELKRKTGGYFMPTPEEALMEAAQALAKEISEKYVEVE